jgi:uncharacterized membrane protein YhdT
MSQKEVVLKYAAALQAACCGLLFAAFYLLEFAGNGGWIPLRFVVIAATAEAALLLVVSLNHPNGVFHWEPLCDSRNKKVLTAVRWSLLVGLCMLVSTILFVYLLVLAASFEDLSSVRRHGAFLLLHSLLFLLSVVVCVSFVTGLAPALPRFLVNFYRSPWIALKRETHKRIRKNGGKV